MTCPGTVVVAVGVGGEDPLHSGLRTCVLVGRRVRWNKIVPYSDAPETCHLLRCPGFSVWTPMSAPYVSSFLCMNKVEVKGDVSYRNEKPIPSLKYSPKVRKETYTVITPEGWVRG